MSNIHSILPLLDNDSWRWNRSEITRERVQPGNREPLFERPRYPGFVYFASVAVRGENADEARIEFDFDRFETDRSIKQIFQVGLTGPSGISPSITRYDADDGFFAVRVSPSVPIGYNDSASISVRAPSNETVLTEAIGLNLEILDMPSFMQSYQRATRGQVIDNVKNLTDKIDTLNKNIELMIEAQPGDVEVPDRDNETDLDFIDNLV
jgi:hypothetical protein